MNTFALPQSAFVPIAVGFFGLGTGYIIWGGQALFGYPAASREVDRTLALWGIWMPGFMQFITGIGLLVGLTWFPVFTATPPLYMAGLAFTAFGIHWFALATRRYIGSNPIPDGWMAIPFFFVSLLGLVIFASAGDYPVMIVFIGLSLIYATEVLFRFRILAAGEKVIAVWQLLTGVWLIYLTWGVALNLSIHAHWWI